MKVYITKYALTSGILCVEPKRIEGDMIEIRRSEHHMPEYFHGEGKDWCRTLEQANEIFETMRQRKLNSLMKQVRLLEGPVSPKILEL